RGDQVELFTSQLHPRSFSARLQIIKFELTGPSLRRRTSLILRIVILRVSGKLAPAKKLARLPVSVGKKYAQHHALLVDAISGAMTIDSGLVTGRSGQGTKSVTINRNQRSRQTRIAGHDVPE
ncbi:hypothetical protein RCH06_002196, partial [Polaromonas sp. CG_9.5]|uniref:hypothetical protein n=1 Tax=Polaromonas sp. CG_9.5 TaxID=3071705 RepID=UPI002DFE11FC|nr:hypothetical protein [Polaromonas sp. CG_9.5]